MADQALVADVRDLFRNAGWDHAYIGSRCFDLFACCGDDALLCKVHPNVDSTTGETADELKQAARYLGATPIIIGDHTSRDALDPHVLYDRYNVPTVNLETLRTYLDLREAPVVMHSKGGYSVRVDGDRFEERRREEGYSLNALAKELGVSRTTVAKYREGGTAAVDTAQRLEQVLGDVLAAVDLVDIEIAVRPAPDNRLARRLVRIGFDASAFSAAPFDAAAQDETDKYVGADAHTVSDTVIDVLVRLQDVAGSHTFLVTDRTGDHGDIPSVSDQRLDELEDRAGFKDAVH